MNGFYPDKYHITMTTFPNNPNTGDESSVDHPYKTLQP